MKKISITHGDALSSIRGDQESSLSFMGKIIEKGITIYKGEFDKGFNDIAVLTGIQGEIRASVVLINKGKRREVGDFYPWNVEGNNTEVEIVEIHEGDTNPYVAVIEAKFHGLTIFFFEPFYFFNKNKYIVGEKITVTLSAILYSLEEVPEDKKELKIDHTLERLKEMDITPEYDENGNLKPVIYDCTKLRSLIPNYDWPGDFWYQTPLDSYETIEGEGNDFIKIGLNFPIEDNTLSINGIIKKSNVGLSNLKEGTPITGNLLINGFISGSLDEILEDFDKYNN